MIKTVFLASLAAVALCAPDADPAVIAGGSKILTPPTPLIHNPPTRPVVAAPLATYGPGIAGGYAFATPFGYGLHHSIGKRDADAEPAIIAGSTKILTPPTPLIHNPPVRPVVAAPVTTYGYGIGAGYGLGAYGLGLGLHHIGKRDAEADPQFYGLAAPFAFASAGAVPHVPVVKSVEVTPAEVSNEVTAHTIPVAVGYHAAPYGAYGLGLGLHHGIGKREADPQFFPALPYAGPVAVGFASAGAVPHVPVVKSIEETAPAEVNHEVTAHAIPVAVGFGGYAHHVAPYFG